MALKEGSGPYFQHSPHDVLLLLVVEVLLLEVPLDLDCFMLGLYVGPPYSWLEASGVTPAGQSVQDFHLLGLDSGTWWCLWLHSGQPQSSSPSQTSSLIVSAMISGSMN